MTPTEDIQPAPPRRYDIDLLEEAVVVKWHAETPYNESSRQVREAAEPFIKWLSTAEEESPAAMAQPLSDTQVDAIMALLTSGERITRASLKSIGTSARPAAAAAADGAVSQDLKDAHSPWQPPTFWEALGTDFLNGTGGETVDIEEIKGKGKYIGLYFSAHVSCTPAPFTPLTCRVPSHSLTHPCSVSVRLGRTRTVVPSVPRLYARSGRGLQGALVRKGP